MLGPLSIWTMLVKGYSLSRRWVAIRGLSVVVFFVLYAWLFFRGVQNGPDKDDIDCSICEVLEPGSNFSSGLRVKSGGLEATSCHRLRSEGAWVLGGQKCAKLGRCQALGKPGDKGD